MSGVCDEPHEQAVEREHRDDQEAAPATSVRSLSSRPSMEARGDPGGGGHLEADQDAEDPGHRRPQARPRAFRLLTIQSASGPTMTSNDRRTQHARLDDPCAAGQADAQALHELLPGRGQQSREAQERDHDRARPPDDFDPLA